MGHAAGGLSQVLETYGPWAVSAILMLGIAGMFALWRKDRKDSEQRLTDQLAAKDAEIAAMHEKFYEVTSRVTEAITETRITLRSLQPMLQQMVILAARGSRGGNGS